MFFCSKKQQITAAKSAYKYLVIRSRNLIGAYMLCTLAYVNRQGRSVGRAVSDYLHLIVGQRK